MKKKIFLFLFLTLSMVTLRAQIEETYFKANAVRIDNPEKLNDSITTILSPYQIVMFGEMHGTNESVPFVSGLTNLFTSKGDSIQVGLEINPELMTKFIQSHTESSIYQSDFFSTADNLDGKESIPWANLIAQLNNNSKVTLFFFDTNRDEKVIAKRDSLMSAKIKMQFNKHPKWKMITLSGNYHNRTTDKNAMTAILKRNLSAKICSLNMEYKEGTANANFSKGLEIKELGSYPSILNSTKGYDRYLLLFPEQSNYQYDGLYYTKYITAAKMVSTK